MEETAPHGGQEGRQRARKWSLDNYYILAIILLAIAALGIYLRTGLLQYQGLFEPDGFFYYTAIRQAAMLGNVSTQMSVLLSGYPWHNGFHEAAGVIYMTLIPYFFLKYVGLSLMTVMRWVPIAFGLLDALAAYFLVQYLSKSKAMGLVAMFFMATSSGNIARTAGTVYRGDTFVSFFVMLALILMLMVFKESKARRKYVYLAATAMLLGASNVVWNGGVIIPAVYFAALVGCSAYSFIAHDDKALYNCILLFCALIVGWVLMQAFLALGLSNETLMALPIFLAMNILITIVICGAYYAITKGKHIPFVATWTGTLRNRIIALITLVAIVMIALYAVAAPYLASLLTNGGSIYVGGNIATTTQELQAPSYSFLWASFGLQLYLAPIAVLLFLLFAHLHGNGHRIKKGRFSLNMNYGFIVLLIYLLIAAYLQNGAIRYNSILAEPLALFSAYAVYLIYVLIKDYSVVLSGVELKFGYIWMGIFLALAIFQTTLTQAQSFASVQADGVNPYFLTAMTWLSHNTPANATVDDLWPDGSLVEGWGNRTSFQDSVGGENATRIVQFGQYIFNTSTDMHYLVDQAYKPQYLLVRNFWFNELGGIAVEANLTGNLSAYGYNLFTGFNAGGNSTRQVYTFTSSVYTTQLVIEPGVANGIQAFISQTGSSGYIPMARVELLNQSTGDFSVTSTTYNQSANLTLLVSLAGRNITSAAVIGPGLYNSNFFKFIMQCGYNVCSYGDANVSAQLVYINPDSKIIKLTYH